MNRRAGNLFPCNPISLSLSPWYIQIVLDCFRPKRSRLRCSKTRKRGGEKCEREKNRASTTCRANEFITIGSWSSVHTRVRGVPIDNQGANQMITSRQNASPPPPVSSSNVEKKKEREKLGLNWECGISEALANCETRPPLPLPPPLLDFDRAWGWISVFVVFMSLMILLSFSLFFCFNFILLLFLRRKNICDTLFWSWIFSFFFWKN